MPSARIHAVRGLATIHDEETLRALAGADADEGAAELSRTFAEYGDHWREELGTTPLARWAKAALGWIQTGRR